MQFVNVTASAAICFYLLLPSSSAAQSGAQPNPYVPIVLDADKFMSFYLELRKLPMPADAHERIAGLLQNLERDAQLEKARKDTKGPSPQEEK